MQYRREVDGLRAIAVLPVILFHAGFQTFSGGFVGVDVFFVISGYLITTIILSELNQGTFSIVNFYERRARRILPALFFVILACIPFAWAWFLPSDMKDFTQSVVSVNTFISNIFFWQGSGYFETASEFKPLLHTWSLAVEEQFYVLFPLLMMFTWRLGHTRVVFILCLVAFSSLALAQWASLIAPSANFFLLPNRAWELLIGSLVAFHLHSGANAAGRAQREIGGLVGLALIFYAIFAYDQGTPFPGVYALAPTVGAALIIVYASPATWVGRLLGRKIFVGIGLISYSAYLWHQPLFAFVRYNSLTEPAPTLLLQLSALSLALAYFSWRFVEQPFRNRKRFTRHGIFTLAAIGSAGFIAFGVAGSVTNGFAKWRPSSVDLVELEARLAPNYGLSSECEGAFATSPSCRTHDEPDTLLWGDSFAMHWAQGLMASSPDIRLTQQTVSVCGPLLGVAPTNAAYTHAWARDCMKFNDEVLALLKNSPSIKYVVLASAFIQYLDYDGFSILTRDGEVVNGEDIAHAALLNTLRTVADLGKVPVVMAPLPQNGTNIGQCLANAVRTNDLPEKCAISFADAKKYRGRMYDFLTDIGKTYRVIWPDEHLCSDGACKAHEGPILIYRDHGHLSAEGSEYVGRSMDLYNRIKLEAKRAADPANQTLQIIKLPR